MPKGNGKPIPKVEVNLDMSKAQGQELLKTLKARFQENSHRHQDLDWSEIQEKLTSNLKKLASLFAMESTAGEPDVIGQDKDSGEFLFVDCSLQTPDRRSICYDREGEKKREKKGLFPGGNAVDLAEMMGIELLDEAQYRNLQEIEDFDTTTSSWIKTPERIRDLGGALTCERRYDSVFTYHNSAESFYGSRGFRGMLRV